MRFVVLFHEHAPGGNHWDLMLEADGVLTTWSLPPQAMPLGSFRCRARRLPDHRLAYLDYEGPVSRDRGMVRRVDGGICGILSENHFTLRGDVFSGTLSIESMHGDDVWIAFEIQPPPQK